MGAVVHTFFRNTSTPFALAYQANGPLIYGYSSITIGKIIGLRRVRS